MNTKNEVSRITVDISAASHKKLKSLAALEGKSMRAIINELIDKQLSSQNKTKECPYSHKPNKKTLNALKNVNEGKNLVRVKDVKKFLKTLGD
ncbi:MAG: hypothetical protein P4L31_02775 [Candidatus Babeliales bacterium]|nr:hypothetical protein [Candidatus Babeliales bacterium]